jgi:hypothetical protein
MATNMDKSLSPAPLGLTALTTELDTPDVPLEIIIEAEGDDAEFDENAEAAEADFNENLAEVIDERVLATLSSDLLADYEEDLNSRKEWSETYVKGLKLLGLKYEERSEPWPGACGVFHPVLMESAIKFQSEAIMETFPAMGPVKTLVIGRETVAKKDSAKRVQDDMNYKLTEEMTEYRPEHERLLFSLALSGNAFKKIYLDPSLGRQTAMFISAEDVVVPYGASNLESAERVTHRMRKTKNEMRRLQVAGFYRDIDLGDPVRDIDEVEQQKAKEQGFSATVDNRFQALEMHVELDIEGYEDVDEDGEPTGIALPYIVTIEKGTGTVLAIRRNWLEDDELKQKRQHFVHYGYIPGFGFYYFGLIHLIGGHAKAATSLLRQLVDAGTLSNLPGGLKSKGLRIKGDDTPIAPGEFRDVDVPSGSIKDNIMTLPYKEPSQTLAGLMDKIIMDAQRFAATADLNVSDMSAQAPVGTTLAVLERLLKVMSAVQARIHYTMKQEFKLLKVIIRDQTPTEYSYEPEVGDRQAKQSDYDSCDVIPVSDPNAATMAQKVVQYQAVMQLAQGAPQLYNLKYLHRQMIEVLGVKNVSKIIPDDDDTKPVDPVSENMAVLTGKPVKAFIYQDHTSHLAVHLAAMHDPKLAQVMAQNPQAQALQAAGMAHIMEHVAFQYRNEIEKQLGAALPPMVDDDAEDGEDHVLPPDVEVQLSALVAQAAQQLLQKNQGEMAQQQAAQQQQDPLIQMQQKELAIKEGDLERKKKKDAADAAAKADEIRIKEQVAATNAAAKADEIRIKESTEGAQAQQKMEQGHQSHAFNMAHTHQKHVAGLAEGGNVHAINLAQTHQKHSSAHAQGNEKHAQAQRHKDEMHALEMEKRRKIMELQSKFKPNPNKPTKPTKGGE